MLKIKIIKLSKKIGKEIPFPNYATGGSAGMDLRACLDTEVEIKPGEIKMISTGICIHIMDSCVGGFVYPRSGISSKYGVSLANCVGVIDSDYTGEILCPMINHGNDSYTIKSGDRIAQIVFMPISKVELNLVEELEHTERGSGGFGSTGV